MKKILTTLPIVILAALSYGQVSVGRGSTYTVYTSTQADKKFAPAQIVNTVNKNSTDISSLMAQNAAFTQQIATMQSNISALTKTTISQQKTIDSLSAIINKPIVVIKPLYTNAAGDSLWLKQ